MMSPADLLGHCDQPNILLRLTFTNLVAKEIYDSVLMDREPIEISNSKFSFRIL